VVLAFVVAIVALGAWLRSRREPPPTPPGASSEFDGHLQDVDSRYSFVFAEETRIVLARIHGTVVRVLLDVKGGAKPWRGAGGGIV
jgi:hypothetical protein